MSLPKHYEPNEIETRLLNFWMEGDIYGFSVDDDRPVYSIDTPPATVSGHLHLGHVYSYSHTDFIARYWRMRGMNVFYPMGFDDNGLPTDRLVEKTLGVDAKQMERQAYINACLELSKEYEQEYKNLWQRLGLSIDWNYSYRTIDEYSRRVSQLSFLDLFNKGLVYMREAPSIWCTECQTSIAQAELNDLKRDSEFITIEFRLTNGDRLPISTTRPELLSACVAVFVHPDDVRYRSIIGQEAFVPIFGQVVPVLEDKGADPEKGTGIVMCCTFGDVTDVTWWYTHQLPLIESIGRDGRLTEAAKSFSDLTVEEGRREIKAELDRRGLIIESDPVSQSVRVHERCDTPAEYITTKQWFIRVLDFKDLLLRNGSEVNWYPTHMKARYQAWVENLNWDWCISRQRFYGVPFPIWYCEGCGDVVLAKEDDLPIDPIVELPDVQCENCGGTNFIPEKDVFDTWATSSMTPQIVGLWNREPELYEKVFPFSLRPQAHEIIRTWAFYTLVKSQYHYDTIPWENIAISGWGIAGEGMGKISKSRGGGQISPMEMIGFYSADAVRYWAASTGPGKDSVISEEKIKTGAKLITKLWNVARFSERFLYGYLPSETIPFLTPADKWILSRTHRLIRRVSELFEKYEYATAKSEIEIYFWKELADNYLEMCKQRLYDSDCKTHEGSQYTLYQALFTTIKLFSPFLPYITEEIYQNIFIRLDDKKSIHISSWPIADELLEDTFAEKVGEILVHIASEVRRYKSENNLSLGSEIKRLEITHADPKINEMMTKADEDLMSITRAKSIIVVDEFSPHLIIISTKDDVTLAVEK
jgi:valyl-tRNA synthetase